MKILLILISTLILTACGSVPKGLPNKFDELEVHLQNGEKKTLRDLGWYKSRKMVFDTSTYQFAMNSISNGGFSAIATPKFCPGVMGAFGLPKIATLENQGSNAKFIQRMGNRIDEKLSAWMKAYSPELENACNVSKLMESVVTERDGVYTHHLKSYNDGLLLQEGFNLFFLLENGSEKILTINVIDGPNTSFYTIKGDKLCELNSKELPKGTDLSVEGFINTIKDTNANKKFPVTCLGGKRAVMDISNMKITGLLSQPSGLVSVNFQEGGAYNFKFVQFTDGPEVLK